MKNIKHLKINNEDQKKSRRFLGEQKRFSPTADYGLTNNEVSARIESNLTHKEERRIARSGIEIIRDNVFTLFTAINFIIFFALLFVRSYNNLIFIGVALSNIFIGIFHEFRSKRAVEKLSILSEISITAVREGKEKAVALNEIVLDDVILLSRGQKVPADCVVLLGIVESDEQHLSGESSPVERRAGDILLSGSVIISGECRARVDKIGGECYANIIADEARRYKRPKSEITGSLRRIIRFLGIAALPLGALMLWRALALEFSLNSAVEQSAAAVLGMIPSGLMLLTSMALAVGVFQLAKRNMLAQQPECIETLSRVDTFCIDKTGTLTTGNLYVVRVDFIEEEAAVRECINDFLCAMPDINATDHALRKHFPIYKKNDQSRDSALSITAFSSERRYSAAHFNGYSLYLGAGESLFSELPQAADDAINGCIEKGMRALVFAKGGDSESSTPKELLAIIFLLDELRPEAKETIEFFQSEGVEVKLISGDNPKTVAHIAGALKITGADKYIDVTGLDDEAIFEAAANYTIFGRAAPHKKMLLIKALKHQGHCVAMVGDGVNDLLALREADCSVALYSGSGAARQLAQLVLRDNDFSSLPHVVMEGRRVINNITRTASLFLTKTLYSLLLTTSNVIIGFAYPFLPIQLSLISICAVGVPAFLLSFEPSRGRISGNFLKNVIERAAPPGLTVYIYLLIICIWGPKLGLNHGEINTLSIYVTGTVCLLSLLKICMPLRGYRCAIFFGMAVLFFALSVTFRDLLELSLPPATLVVIMYVVMALLCLPVIKQLSKLAQRLLANT